MVRCGFIMVALLLPASANCFAAASRDLPVLFPIQQQGKWGFIDRTSKVAVPPQFEHTADFHGGRASVKVRDKFGFVNETGNVVIPPQFNQVAEFSEGLARMAIGEKWGFVDVNGKIVISSQFTATPQRVKLFPPDQT